MHQKQTFALKTGNALQFFCSSQGRGWFCAVTIRPAVRGVMRERGMSALGQKQTYALQQAMSALPPIATAKADIATRNPVGNQQ
jgi:hypothetical protein